MIDIEKIEIGKNLKFEKLAFVALTDRILQLRDASDRLKEIPLEQIQRVDIIGVKSASGFCGTSEWGMSNPTFLLPINFIFNLRNIFKRKKDCIHIKVMLKDGSEFIVLGSYDLYEKLC